jgi:hypothetical protein
MPISADKWFDGVNFEVGFWQNYLKTKGARWPDDYSNRLDPNICAAISHVRFTPKSDRKSEFPQTVMSALPPKADMCGAVADVC